MCVCTQVCVGVWMHCRHEYMSDSQYGLAIGLSLPVIYKAINPPSSSFFLTQPQGRTCSLAITQRQMARNLPSVSRQITHTPRGRHCQASFTSSPPGGSPYSLFVCQKNLSPESDGSSKYLTSLYFNKMKHKICLQQ